MKLSVHSRPSDPPTQHHNRVRGMLQTGMVYSSRWAPESLMLDRDMRQCPRRSLHCEMTLIDPATEAEDELFTIAGECLDISKNGLYGIVPSGFDLHPARVFIFQLAILECGPEPGVIQTVSQKGRIVRTELLAGRDVADRIGFGAQLIGPRTGVVSLPS